VNKFQDEFSNNSYEELLSEYAGDSITSKPIKNTEERKPKPVYRELQDSSRDISSFSENFPAAEKKKAQSFDIDLLKAYEEPVQRRVVKKEEPQNKGKFTVNIDYAKTFAIGVVNKVRTVADNVRENANAAAEHVKEQELAEASEPVEFKSKKKRKKLTFNDIVGHTVNSVRENKQQFTAFCCCLLVSFILAGFAISCVNDVLAINRDGEETIEVVLPDNADTAEAIRILDKAGLIKNSLFCNLFAKVMGVSDDNYLAGIYYFTDDMGVEKMLTRFKTSSTRGTIISITVPEGYTVDQIFERLEKNNICTKESLYRVLNTVDFGNEYDFIAKIDNKDERYCILEGYLFPATYEFEQGAEPASVIRKFLDAFQSRWTEEFAAKATELGMSVDEIVILASILEKEGTGEGQFLQISSVLHNRLNRSGLYPTLDCNSTKDYVKNTVAKRITTPEINKYVVSYNTYEIAGLPPSAICNPGLDAIESALFPTPSKNYFFRHDKNNDIYLAETIEEHNANGRLVQRVNSGG
jgi:UPF0755 protein